MKGEHYFFCKKVEPTCLCNTCKHDYQRNGLACCDHVSEVCPTTHCPDYEPDDEEDGNA